MANNCPTCHSDNPETQRFCGECGTQLPLPQDHPPVVTETLQTPARELTTGSTFAGRYQVIEELGHGGMGRVYKVQDTDIKEKVALKLLRPEITLDKEAVERFSNELKLARKISHRNICRMFDLGRAEGTTFITMEFVPGEDLKSFIHRAKQLSIGTAISIAKQVCEGLEEAHRLGVVHRDLKPGNIMIDKDGDAKIMDFGIARSLSGKGITGAGVLIGTPEYMSPEQVEGKDIDQRSDLYSLGVILYEMVTGQVPFEGETPLSVAHKHRYEEPLIPRKLAPQIPEGLNKLILRCLEKDKAKRYQTAEELLADLATVEDSLPTAERVAPKRKTTTHREVTVKFQPRKLVIPAAAVLILAVASFLIFRYVVPKPAPPLPSAKPMIAVLYLKNSSGDPALDKWKENLPTLLAAGLAQSRYLRIIDDATVYGILKKLDLLKSEKYTPEELKAIAAEGGATHLLSGNFFTAGSKFIINLSLVDADTGTTLKSLEEEAPNQDAVFNSADNLVKKIKVALNIPEQLIEEGTYKMVGEVYTRNPQALQFYIEGEKAHQGGDPDKAIAAFEKAIGLDPGFAMAYRTLSICYMENLNFVKEYQNLHKAYELREKLPEKDRLLIEGTWFTLREETLPKAYPTFKRAVERYPDDYQARWNMALWEDDPDESNRELEYLLHSQNQVKSTYLYWTLAIGYCRQEDYKRAREFFEEGVKVLSPEPWLHRALARLFQLEKNLDAALREYEKAATLAPNEIRYKAEAVAIDWVKEDPDKALATLGSLLKGQKDPSMFDYWRAIFFMVKGKFKDVLDIDNKAEKTAISAGGGNAELGYMLMLKGKNLLQTGNPDKALEKFRASRAYIKKEEDNFPEKDIENLIHYRRMSMLWQICTLCDMGRVGDAEALYREYEPLIPKYFRKKGQRICICSNAALPAGKIALAKRDGPEAIRQLEESLREMRGEDFQWNNNSDHAYILDVLGDAYQMGGQLDKAAETYARIRELQNGRADWGAVYARSYYKLAKVYEQMGKKAEAREKYAKFLDLWRDADPGLPEVADAKRRLASF